MVCPVVFLHGFLGSPLDWHALLPWLSPTFSPLCLDLPLHHSNEISSFDDLLDHLPRTPFHLVGYSMGGRLALEVFRRKSASIKSLSLLSTHLGLRTSKERESKEANELFWARYLEQKSFENFLQLWNAQELFGKNQISTSTQQQLDPKKIQNALLEFSVAKQHPFWKDLMVINAPVLYVAGAQDKKYFTLAQEIKKECPQVSVEILSNAFHRMHIDKPKETATLLNNFILRRGI